MNGLFVAFMVVLSIILVAVILMQPDKSQTVAKTESILDQEKRRNRKIYRICSSIIFSISSSLQRY